MKAFNLAHQPWIPVILNEKTPLKIGLLQCLFESDTIEEVYHDSPLVVMSMYRLLLAFVHRIFPLENKEQWGELFSKGFFPPHEIENYFRKWDDRFWLFHSRYPFYQVTEIPGKSEPISCNKLVLHRAAGNNAVYHDHSNEFSPSPLTASDAALHLVTFQNFATGGGKSSTINFRSSPFSSSLICLLSGTNIFQTLMLNYIIKPDISSSPNDLPVWEKDSPLVPEESSQPEGYLDYLTIQSRMVKLIPYKVADDIFISQMQFAQGRGLPKGLRDPFITYLADKKEGYRPVKIYPQRLLWRDYHTLITLSSDGNIRAPLNLSQASELEDSGFIEGNRIYTLFCGGLASDKAKLLLWRGDKFPLPLGLLDNQDFINTCTDAIAFAESKSKRLYFFTKNIIAALISYDNLKADKDAVAKLYDAYSVEPLFWSELELPFKEFVVNCFGSAEAELNAYQIWEQNCNRVLSKCMRSVESAVIGEPRGPKAIAQAFNSSIKEN